MNKGRFPGFYKLSVVERIKAILKNDWINEADYEDLSQGSHILDLQVADKMIENVVGVMGLPLGIGLNFLINHKEYIIPLVVEEPSIVAALSHAAKIFRDEGGIECASDESLLIGQVQVVDITDLQTAKRQLEQNKDALIEQINRLHPNMVARGGGIKDMEVRLLPESTDNQAMLILHLLVDTCDAMGANIVNTMCEEIAPRVEEITKGRVFLRILSNLTDRSLVRASVTLPVKALEGKGYSGEEVRDGIILASEFAVVDPYRAATHNKGIMNGIDPVAVATGNDWRAIEAAAHAFAAKSGRYQSLSRWTKSKAGHLLGSIEIPLKVGIQGGSLQANATTAINLRMLGVESARELAEVMAAVGLAQNFSALKALATEGIQKGHMSLHARSVAVTAGAPAEIFEELVSALIEDGDISVTRAKELINRLHHNRPLGTFPLGSHPLGSHPLDKHPLEKGNQQGNKSVNLEKSVTRVTSNGKVILLGEHSVVYGRPAVAIPIADAVFAEVSPHAGPIEIKVPGWKLDVSMDDGNSIWWSALTDVFSQMGVDQEKLLIDVKPNIPPAMGLGGSAAIAVAVIRALSEHCQLNLDDDEVNNYAFHCERAAHGTPSGIDNTVATYGKPFIFQTGEAFKMETLKVKEPICLVVGISGQASLTLDMVGGVRDRWRKDTDQYEKIFDRFQQTALSGIEAIQSGDLTTLGEMMSYNHKLLQEIQVSSADLDDLVELALKSGALGAKLTGAGGGGSMVALCRESTDRTIKAIEDAGCKTLTVNIPCS